MRLFSTRFTPWSPIGAISRWRNAAELRNCSQEDVEQMAQEVGLTALELRQLARKGTHAADALPLRMATLDLDPKQVGQREPMVLRDMERVCSMCESRRRCFRDLTRNANDPAWKQYCPNAETLASLDALPWVPRREF